MTRRYFGSLLLAGTASCWLSGCGGESIGIYVKPPGNLARGERGKATITVNNEDHHAGQTITVRLLPGEHILVDPSQVKVKLDAQGSGDVTVYVTPKDSAPSGEHTVGIISITDAGHETRFEFSFRVK